MFCFKKVVVSESVPKMYTGIVHHLFTKCWPITGSSFRCLRVGQFAVWSESGLEVWSKHIRNFRSGVGCGTRQTSVKPNLEDISVCMLIMSSPNVAKSL